MEPSYEVKSVDKQHHQHPPHQQRSQTTPEVPSNPSNCKTKSDTTHRQKPEPTITVDDLEIFFQDGLYNSCQATDELIKSIEQSHDDNLAKKALNLYQSHYATLDRPWDHVTFMYGLGLIYMHFNAYSWAVKSFREAIYVQPNFPRSRDVHTRLGLIFKSTGRYRLSEKHFKLAINDTRLDSGTITRLELRFHLAHLYEIQGKLEQAIEAYERLLQENNLPRKLSANIQRQLGWIYYVSAFPDPHKSSKIDNQMQNGSKSTRDNSCLINRPDPGKLDVALNYLSLSYRTDCDSETSYYLGRCLTNIGKFQDALASYRSVNKDEFPADTWCSIGVLYHRRNQPWDALQSYIRSVQFDKKHTVAWMNLGVLYEGHHQFRDALKCYQHVLRSNPTSVDRNIQARIKYIQKHVDEIESTGGNGKPQNHADKLLSLEDLWNLESDTNSGESSASKSDSGKLQPNHVEATHDASKSLTLKMSVAAGTSTISPKQQIDSDSKPTPAIIKQQTNGPILNDNPTQSNRAQHTPNQNDEINMKLKNDTDSKLNILSITNNHVGSPVNQDPATKIDCKLEPHPPQSSCQDHKTKTVDSKELSLNQAFTNGASKDSGISSNSSTYADSALVPSQSTDDSVSTYVSGDQVIESSRYSNGARRIDVNALNDDDRPPHLFSKSPPYPPLNHDKLFPSPPSIFLETKKDLMSGKLQDICQSNPISIVRNIATVLKLDLGLFSTKTLVESSPDQQVDVVSHLFHSNNDSNSEHNPRNCDRQKSTSTISRYAHYQVSSFQESLREEKEGKCKQNSTKESETDSNESASNAVKKNNTQSTSSTNDALQHDNESNHRSGPVVKKIKKEQPKTKYVRSAEQIDLSDEKLWRAQLNELNKLPHFLRCISASNMLTHIGSNITGVNTVSMSMHVPGCRIVGNKAPNNFCPVNINTGPGDYEWSAVPAEYERVLMRLCNNHGFESDERLWWPKMNDLKRYNVPVYRFTQRPGDLVWVNSGTFYWVQATGWTNCIEWNVGPLNAKQYWLTSESFEINKLLFRKSDVAVVQMTWNIIMNIHIISDKKLLNHFIDVLRRSMRYCVLIKELVEREKGTIRQLDVELGPRPPKFCNLCEGETFNISFRLRQNDDELHCVECARRLDTSFSSYIIKQDYDLGRLVKLYDEFIDINRKFQSRLQDICPQKKVSQRDPTE